MSGYGQEFLSCNSMKFNRNLLDNLEREYYDVIKVRQQNIQLSYGIYTRFALCLILFWQIPWASIHQDDTVLFV